VTFRSVPAQKVPLSPRFATRAKVTTTLAIYAQLFEDDHVDAMALLGVVAESPPKWERGPVAA
jgi:hypothetical protein